MYPGPCVVEMEALQGKQVCDRNGWLRMTCRGSTIWPQPSVGNYSTLLVHTFSGSALIQDLPSLIWGLN